MSEFNDPTYDRKIIDANPVWAVAFVLSECHNGAALIGWSSYIWIAEELHHNFTIKPKRKQKGQP